VRLLIRRIRLVGILWGACKTDKGGRGLREREMESLGREQVKKVKFLLTAIRGNCEIYQVYTYIPSRELQIPPRSIFSVPGWLARDIFGDLEKFGLEERNMRDRSRAT
jgi:hypothetical protein